MTYFRLSLFSVTAAATMAFAPAAQAFCSNNWADVTILCPNPVPFTGPKKLTPTSRHLPTKGKPGIYKNYTNAGDVRVYLGGNGTGYQDFHWEKN